LLFAALVAGGCASKADELTQRGLNDLEKGELRNAHKHFSQAHADDSEHGPAALGFALTSLVLLPENPSIEAALADLGFTGPIDIQSLLLGDAGVLCRGYRKESCDGIDGAIKQQIPYPALHEPKPSPASLVREGLTFSDLLAHAAQLDDELADIARALVSAAQSTAEEPITFELGHSCGTQQKVTVQAPELYTLAGYIETARAIIQYLRAYDWDISVALVLDEDADPQTKVAALNTHLGHVRAKEHALAAKPALQHALALSNAALDAIRNTSETQAAALFDWTQVPNAVLDDVQRLMASITDAFEGPTSIADMVPQVRLNLRAAFENPPNYRDIPLFSLTANETGRKRAEFSSAQLFKGLQEIYVGPSDDVDWKPASRGLEFSVRTEHASTLDQAFMCTDSE